MIYRYMYVQVFDFLLSFSCSLPSIPFTGTKSLSILLQRTVHVYVFENKVLQSYAYNLISWSRHVYDVMVSFMTDTFKFCIPHFIDTFTGIHFSN